MDEMEYVEVAANLQDLISEYELYHNINMVREKYVLYVCISFFLYNTP